MKFRVALGAALGLWGLLAAAPTAGADNIHRIECDVPETISALAGTLERFSARLARGETVTVLAIGSSSTAGVGASNEDLSYPSRLAAELRTLLPQARVDVLNHGISGEDAQEMVTRMQGELIATSPDLVLWQVGTNALLRDDGIDHEASIIRNGLRQIRDFGADIVLIDPQYAPKVLRDPDARPMVQLLSRLAAEFRIPVFRRFALMEHWHQDRGIAFAETLSPDLFHMNDWSYGCFAKNLAHALVPAAIARGQDSKTQAQRAPTDAANSNVTTVSIPR
ncbi:MAG: SGNH/GDSL hydrolase family protein [Bradyrhizobiaceae bacterium]|nr:SGNH/GDSL hydrolase family protein [Bradyrhizobiaceae bacterium]